MSEINTEDLDLKIRALELWRVFRLLPPTIQVVFWILLVLDIVLLEKILSGTWL